MPTVRYTTVDGEVIAEKRSGVRKHYVPDPLGSTVALLDNNQTQTDTFSYWPFGEVQTRTGTTLTPFLYNGTRGFHHDSGSRIYVDDRYLSTSLARWFTSDLDREANGQNTYEYDLSGMQATTPDRKGMFFSENDSDKIDDAVVSSCQLTITLQQFTYGKYCGPQQKKGKGRGIDSLDDCCRGHDACFQKNGCTVGQQWTAACLQCTTNLCTCANKLASCAGHKGFAKALCIAAKAAVSSYACNVSQTPPTGRKRRKRPS